MVPALEAPTWNRQKRSTWMLGVLAGTTLLAWQAGEYWAQWHFAPRPELLAAADRMMAATAVIRQAKRAQGLLQPSEIDRNQTGLVGPEWTEITTTIGDPEAKRTTTNADLAALMARVFRSANPAVGDTVAVVLSGSFVGGNIAVLSAIETMGLTPIIVSSLGASMYGANDPAFTWVDMEALVRSAGIWRAQSALAVLGGEAGRARDLAPSSQAMLRAAAARQGIPLLDEARFHQSIDTLVGVLRLDQSGLTRPKFLVNVGGAQIALGTCTEADRVPSGWMRQRIACSEGTRGLVQRALERGIPVFNVFKIKQLARQYGLPYDPVPLPPRGENRTIYHR